MNSPSEDSAERARRYIASFQAALRQHSLAERDSTVKADSIRRVSDTMHQYLQDAQYYLENRRPTTSLASIAYAEGLLDALKFLELARPQGSQ